MLTRAEQDAILALPVAVYRRLHARAFGHLPSTTGTLESFRAALRLDDFKLSLMIAVDAHKQPWQTPWPKEVPA